MRHGTSALVVMVALVMALPAFGQDLPSSARYSGPEEVPAGSTEAIPLGPFLFSPALQLTWQDRDNIFFTPDNEVSDQLYLARARMLFELPIYESYVRFSYTPQYRDFQDYELEDKWSHFVNAAAAFEFASGVSLDLSYDYIIGTLETREVDPGGELLFGDQKFTKNRGRANLGYWFAPRDGLFVEADWTDVEYDNEDLFFPYQRLFGAVGWKHQLSPVLNMDVRYGRTEFDADNFADIDNSFRDSSSDELTLGFNGQLSPVTAAELRVGYRQTSFDEVPGEPVNDDFQGIIATGFISWELAHGSQIRLDVLRSDYPSYFSQNAYYTATGGTLAYRLDRGHLFGQLRGRYQTNDYDLPDLTTGVVRSDDVLSADVGLGVRFTDVVSLYGSYLYEDRDSNIYEYGYTTNIFTIGLVFGY